MSKWEKGKSGNPGGRPKTPEGLANAFRESSWDAYKVCIAIMKGKDKRLALEASKVVLDRAFGKPAQALSVTGGAGGPLFPVDAAREMLATLLEKKRNG